MGTVPAPNIAELGGQIAAAPLNTFAEYQRAAQLEQQNKQARVMAPLQEQEAQQQIEAQRRQLADQNATTKSFLDWDHKDPNELAASVVRNGGSAAAAQAVQQHYFGMQKTASDIAKQDAETGSSLLKTKVDQYNQDAGRLAALDDVPDEQFMQHLTEESGKLAASKDPQEQQSAQHIQQLTQLPVAEARRQLKVIEHALLGEKEIHEQTLNDQKAKTELLNAQTAANRLQAELPGGPLESPDKAQQRAWLARPENKGKDAADFLAWKAKQSPMAVVMGNMLQGDALDQAAERYSQTGQVPQGFSRSPGTTAAVLKRSAELHPDQNLASNSASFKANESSLRNLQKNFDQVSAFENTAIRNLDLYASTAGKIPDLQARFANVPLRMITGKMIGEQNYAAMQAARQTAAAEVAKVLSSANASGVLSDTQKKEAEDVLDGNYPLAATLKVIQTLKQDFSNRHQSYQMQIGDIQQRLGAKTQTGGSAYQVGEVFVQNGHRYKVTKVDQNGKVTAANPI